MKVISPTKAQTEKVAKNVTVSQMLKCCYTSCTRCSSSKQKTAAS